GKVNGGRPCSLNKPVQWGMTIGRPYGSASRSLTMASPPKAGAFSLSLAQAASEIDPVCGMTVDPATAAGSTAFEGKTYYFCNPSCLKKFQADPHRYLHRGPRDSHHEEPAPPPGAAVEYTCPMHPEV